MPVGGELSVSRPLSGFHDHPEGATANSQSFRVTQRVQRYSLGDQGKFRTLLQGPASGSVVLSRDHMNVQEVP